MIGYGSKAKRKVWIGKQGLIYSSALDFTSSDYQIIESMTHYSPIIIYTFCLAVALDLEKITVLPRSQQPHLLLEDV